MELNTLFYDLAKGGNIIDQEQNVLNGLANQLQRISDHLAQDKIQQLSRENLLLKQQVIALKNKITQDGLVAKQKSEADEEKIRLLEREVESLTKENEKLDKENEKLDKENEDLGDYKESLGKIRDAYEQKIIPVYTGGSASRRRAVRLAQCLHAENLFKVTEEEIKKRQMKDNPTN